MLLNFIKFYTTKKSLSDLEFVSLKMCSKCHDFDIPPNLFYAFKFKSANNDSWKYILANTKKKSLFS